MFCVNNIMILMILAHILKCSNVWNSLYPAVRTPGMEKFKVLLRNTEVRKYPLEFRFQTYNYRTFHLYCFPHLFLIALQ